MYSFKNDYNGLVHPDILKIMAHSLEEQNDGYGHDQYTQEACRFIQQHIQKKVEIHLLVGGTSTNKILISHILKPYEAVIAIESGHINVHEAGAIENTGHKILTVKGRDGKITSSEIIQVVKQHQDEHVVIPKLVYISNATEFGTIYSKKELEEISNTCKDWNLYLFVDGARLAAALTSKENDVTLNDIAHYADFFYIGGTKNGAMIGEALVLCNLTFSPYFRNTMKLHGGMLAKGYLIGMQFVGLFQNDLIFHLAQYANDLAEMLKDGLKQLHVSFVISSPTNLQFVRLPNYVVRKLETEYLFEIWEDGRILNQDDSIIRLVTSWNTKKVEVEKFINYLSKILKEGKE